jgi:glycosyltransferase involved in cell wall biosynthesis
MRVALPLMHCWNRVPGGTARASIELARAVRTRGRVELVGVKPAGAELTEDLESLDIGWAELGPKGLPLPIIYDLWVHTSVLPVERAFGRRSPFRPELIHYSAPIVPRSGRTPVSATIHDVFPLSSPDAFTGRGVRLMRGSLHHLASRAVRIGCSSEATKLACERFGFRAERLQTIPLGVAVAPPGEGRDAIESAPVRARFGLERPFVLWVGTVEPRKNLGAVLSISSQLAGRGMDLVLVGPQGWANASDEVQRAAAAEDNVRWLGRVTDRERDGLYRAAEVFVFPSFEEGFGLPVIEAMAQGTPVVTSAGTATEEAAGGCAALVDPADRPALWEATRRLLDEPGERERMTASGRAWAQTQTWERCAAAYEDLWAAALDVSQPGEGRP